MSGIFVTEIVAVALAGCLILAALIARPFWLFHLSMNFPMIGRVDKDARMAPPSAEKANGRLEAIYRAYANKIDAVASSEEFERARAYLFLAGDSEITPPSWSGIALLILFLAADAASFSYQLGSRFNIEASEDVVGIIAGCLITVFVALLATFGHFIGGSIRRTMTLGSLAPHLIDPARIVPGERSALDLTSRVSLEDDQNRDRPLKNASDPQRAYNRIGKLPGEHGSYIPAAAYAILIGGLAAAQFKLRMASSFATRAIDAFNADLSKALATVAPTDDSSMIANATFCVIFLATQAYAVRSGMRHSFVGIDSKRAYERLKGADTHSEFDAAYAKKVRNADTTLSNLLSKLKRYTNIGQLDEALFMERVDRDRAATQPEAAGPTSPPPAAETNVFPIADGGGM